MKFTLIKNNLYRKQGDPQYVACTRVNGRLTREHVISRLSYVSTLTDADIMAVLSGFEKVLVEFLSLGYSIDLGFLSLGFSIKGRFDSPEEGFHRDRNWVSVNARVKKSFNMAVNNASRPEKIFSNGIRPHLTNFKKISPNKAHPDPQAGNLVKISGNNLAFDIHDTKVGVFLHPSTGRAVHVSEYAKSGISYVFFKIPDNIKSSIYKVEIRTRSRYGKIISGFFDEPVVIRGIK